MVDYKRMPLVQKKKELSTVLENISDGILFIDSKGVIKVCNRALTQMLSINDDCTGELIFSLPLEHPVRKGIFRADKGFAGPYCWERNKCSVNTDCPGKDTQCCRCWVLNVCTSFTSIENKSCIECAQYHDVKKFLEKPKELETGEKIISVTSSFIEHTDKNEIWEVIVFKDVTSEKLDAVMKLANATAHELRQPLQIIISSLSLVSDELPDNSEIKVCFQTVTENCHRMNEIIEKISHITRYKTKQYIFNERILDIEESSGSPEDSE